MAPWVPGELVKPSEIIGRRIFRKIGEPEVNDVGSISPNLFLDTRYHEDLSLDRLGDGQPHKATVIFVTKLGDTAAADNNQVFTGWMATQRKNVKFEEVRPDALTLEKDGVLNPFHALLDRSAARERSQAFHLSRSLYMSFKENGRLVEAMRGGRGPASSQIEIA